MKKLNEFLKPLGTNILINSKGEEKKSNIISPNLGGYKNHREWTDKKNFVIAIGDEVKKVKIGDMVLLKAHCPLGRMDKITEIVEKKLGIKISENIKDQEGKDTGYFETKETFFIVKEEDIIGIIN